MKATDFPRKGKIKATDRECIITGEGNVAGIRTYRVKFSKRGREVDYIQSNIIVLGRYDPEGWNRD